MTNKATITLLNGEYTVTLNLFDEKTVLHHRGMVAATKTVIDNGVHIADFVPDVWSSYYELKDLQGFLILWSNAARNFYIKARSKKEFLTAYQEAVDKGILPKPWTYEVRRMHKSMGQGKVSVNEYWRARDWYIQKHREELLAIVERLATSTGLSADFYELQDEAVALIDKVKYSPNGRG